MALIEYKNGKLEDMATTGYKIVDFYANWCGPCKMMASVLEDLAAENPDVEIIKVNTDEHQELAMEYGVMSIPTVYVYKDNKEIHKLIGFRDKSEFEKIIKS